MSAIVVLLVAWVLLSVPVALLLGGVLRMSERRSRAGVLVDASEHVLTR